ncbi:MAG: ParB/RepB/Spo0J family partition protein, partial [Oscillospiraceae bacterium]|nr:ParB/RepB/Spo0J family partition protein [Oscillospiraceae bacterium]
MATKKKGGLGKGLDALFMDNTTESGPVTLRIAEIEPNREQPRKEFDESALADLADSIREHGVIQPLLVRPMPTGGYQLVAGERRWRASRMAGLTEVPVVIRELSDHETMELALIENLQRQDLNPMEEALGYQSLMNEYAMTQEQADGVLSVIETCTKVANYDTSIYDIVNEQAQAFFAGQKSVDEVCRLIQS